jgi:hypothetical protein
MTMTMDKVSRRGVLAGLVSGLLAALPLALGVDDTEAKKKRGKKKKKKTKQPLPSPLPPPALNVYGCVDAGQACRGDSALCCSGICQGAPPQPGQADTSVCVAHKSGICYADSNSCTLAAAVRCDPSDPNNTSCICTLTTGNAGFCADFTNAFPPSATCRFCSVDTDCHAEFGPGAACIVLGGHCTAHCAATGRTACMPPCA